APLLPGRVRDAPGKPPAKATRAGAAGPDSPFFKRGPPLAQTPPPPSNDNAPRPHTKPPFKAAPGPFNLVGGLPEALLNSLSGRCFPAPRAGGPDPEAMPALGLPRGFFNVLFS
ncbi:hypothetical protein DQ04_25321000, partial [Trypanosoma grayi]|uniref:hypothetical protein n=1 Tax=Trypanosoma grayi TaxID=71804 RepID=UPI0004F42D2C